MVSDNGIFVAKKLILTPGMWMAKTFQQLNIPYRIQKNQVVWFDYSNEHTIPEKLPIFMCEYQPEKYLYGIPNFGHGVKIGLH